MNTKTSKSSVSKAALSAMSIENLKGVADALGITVPAKASKTALVTALVKAGNDGKVHFKHQTAFSISFKPDGGTRKTFYAVASESRNYVSGPGLGNVDEKILVTPDNPVGGSAI